jgi:catechol 2,3-dioxygenase-like lactoylglutathione lyase family enzyme
MSLVSGVDFVVVATKDIEAAEEFYGSVLGLPVGARYGRMPGVEFETGSLTIAVMQSEAFGMTFAANPSPIALHVDDTHAARAELESRGVEFAADTIDSGVCHMAFFRDPDGNALMLHHRYKPREG